MPTRVCIKYMIIPLIDSKHFLIAQERDWSGQASWPHEIAGMLNIGRHSVIGTTSL